MTGHGPCFLDATTSSPLHQILHQTDPIGVRYQRRGGRSQKREGSEGASDWITVAPGFGSEFGSGP